MTGRAALWDVNQLPYLEAYLALSFLPQNGSGETRHVRVLLDPYRSMRERETDDVEKSWKHETGFHRDRSQMRACVVLLLAIAPCVRGRSDAPLLQRSVAQAPRLNFLRASATGQAKGTVRRSESSLDSPERPLQATAFLFVMGLSLVTLTPTSHFIKSLGPERGMKWLTMISTMSAATEIGLSPLVGGLSDAFGRKSVLAITLGLSLLVNCAAAAFPTLLPLGISKFVSSFVVGIFFLAAVRNAPPHTADMLPAHDPSPCARSIFWTRCL